MKGGFEHRKFFPRPKSRTAHSRARVLCDQVEHNKVIAAVTSFSILLTAVNGFGETIEREGLHETLFI
jgi:hypothetical protein